MDVFTQRLREAFGSDTQEEIGRKLHMTQASVSRLLSGRQNPTADTLRLIAEVYGVSLDWLFGRPGTEEPTYEATVRMLLALKNRGASLEVEKECVALRSDDALLMALVRRALAFKAADWDLYKGWLDRKLALFGEKPLLYSGSWQEEDVDHRADAAVSESDWLEAYDQAKGANAMLEDVFGVPDYP